MAKSRNLEGRVRLKEAARRTDVWRAEIAEARSNGFLAPATKLLIVATLETTLDRWNNDVGANGPKRVVGPKGISAADKPRRDFGSPSLT